MKIYTIDVELTAPIMKKIYAPRWSDWAIGVKVTKDGVAQTGEMTLTLDGVEQTAEADTVGGYTVFKQASENPEGKTYVLQYGSQYFNIDCIVTSSSTFDVGTSGGGGGGDITPGLNLSADGMEVGMKPDITLGSISAASISADLISADQMTATQAKATQISAYLLRGNANLADLTCSNTASIASLTSPYITVGDGATAGTLDATNGVVTLQVSSATAPNAGFNVSDGQNSYGFGVHELSGTFDDGGVDTSFRWKILASPQA